MEKEKIEEKKEKKLMLVNKSALSTKQVLHLLQSTPKAHVYKRPAKGGGQWDYVTGTYVKKTLNYAFGWMWSSEIVKIEESHGQVVAIVKLTIQDSQGNPIIWKTDIGKKDIMFKKDTKDPMDFGNDMKSAVTDGLKRCAAQLGIASDIYGKEEFKEIEAESFVETLTEEKLNEPATDAQIETIKTLMKAQNSEEELNSEMTYGQAIMLIKKFTDVKGTNGNNK